MLWVLAPIDSIKTIWVEVITLVHYVRVPHKALAQHHVISQVMKLASSHPHCLPTTQIHYHTGVTVDYRIGSVWFVRAIGFAYLLWHRQTIRFLWNIQTQLQSTVLQDYASQLNASPKTAFQLKVSAQCLKCSMPMPKMLNA